MAGIEFDLNTSNPEDLSKIFDQIEADGEQPTTPDPTTDAQVDDKPAQPETQKAEQGQTEQAADTEANAEGVATKDGKHVIPYSVLKGERDRASRAEQLANEMKERVAALEAMVKSGNQEAKPGDTASTDPQPTESDLSPEDLAALKEDFPTVYKAVMASMAAADRLKDQLQPVQEKVRSQEAEQQRSAQETVQDAIDSIPKLAHIQASNKEAFELAKQFDSTLRGQAAWANKPISERFSKITEMVESALGPIDLPTTSQANAEDIRKAAIAKASQSAKATKTDVPTSLSEFPAGQHAAQDEREAAESLTTLQLAEKFSRMTPDQMDAYFQTI